MLSNNALLCIHETFRFFCLFECTRDFMTVKENKQNEEQKHKDIKLKYETMIFNETRRNENCMISLVIMQRLTRICIAQLVIKCHIRTFGDFR